MRSRRDIRLPFRISFCLFKTSENKIPKSFIFEYHVVKSLTRGRILPNNADFSDACVHCKANSSGRNNPSSAVLQALICQRFGCIGNVSSANVGNAQKRYISTVVVGIICRWGTTRASLLNKLSQLTLFPRWSRSIWITAWEQRKLGNCGTTYGGLTGKTKEDFGHGSARFIPYTNVFDNPLTDTKRLEAVEIDSSQNQVAYGDVFFTVSSETPDEVGMSSVWLSDQEDVYLNSFCFGYRQDSTFDPHYLAYMLRSSSVRSNLTLLAQGISRFNISKNKVMELNVPVPSAVEQKQLGQYFTKLDNLITLHQREPRFADTG